MFLLGFRRKLTALTLCKSIESAILWFQIYDIITFATIQNPAVYFRVHFFYLGSPTMNRYFLYSDTCTSLFYITLNDLSVEHVYE